MHHCIHRLSANMNIQFKLSRLCCLGTYSWNTLSFMSRGPLLSTQIYLRRSQSTESMPNFDIDVNGCSNTNINTIEMSNKNSGSFFQQYLNHELSVDSKIAKEIYFLYQPQIEKHYSNSDSLIQLCNFLKIFFTAENLSYNPKLFTMPFDVVYNRFN